MALVTGWTSAVGALKLVVHTVAPLSPWFRNIGAEMSTILMQHSALNNIAHCTCLASFLLHKERCVKFCHI